MAVLVSPGVGRGTMEWHRQTGFCHKRKPQPASQPAQPDPPSLPQRHRTTQLGGEAADPDFFSLFPLSLFGFFSLFPFFPFPRFRTPHS